MRTTPAPGPKVAATLAGSHPVATVWSTTPHSGRGGVARNPGRRGLARRWKRKGRTVRRAARSIQATYSSAGPRPAGTQSGQMFRLRGKGVINVNGRDRGDLMARLIVEVPTHLNGEQRQRLEEFALLCGEENTPMRKRFFERAKEFFRDA